MKKENCYLQKQTAVYAVKPRGALQHQWGAQHGTHYTYELKYTNLTQFVNVRLGVRRYPYGWDSQEKETIKIVSGCCEKFVL